MQFQTLILSILPALASAINVSYDTGYDIGSRSLSVVACSDGSNGLLTRGFTTQDSLPHFPLIGGASTVEAWNSASCGKCYSLTFEGRSINVIAIDHADVGFNVAQGALDQLTGGRAVEVGHVDAAWAEVPASNCGL